MTRSAAQLKEDQGVSARGNASRIRRLLVGVTSQLFWQLLGVKSHEREGRQPTYDVENFSGIGFYARPRTTDRAEAVVASIGDARHQVIVATRNEDVRKTIAQLDTDETAIFTSTAIVIIKQDGTIEIRSAGGTAVSLATKSDVQRVTDKLNALIATHNAHVHGGVVTGGGLTLVPDDVSMIAVADPDGTSILKAE